MTENQHIPGAFAAMLEAITETVTDGNLFLPKKKRDKGDTFCGTLPYYMQKLWLHMEMYRRQTDEIVAKITDLGAIHAGEHTRLGAEIPAATCEKFSREVDELSETLNRPYRTFLALEQMFNAAVTIEFPGISGAKVIGVRENFELVTRTNDNRGDTDDPLDPISLPHSKGIHFTVVVKKASKPGVTNPPTKEG